MKVKSVLAAIGFVVMLNGCVTNPLTGRSSIQLGNNQELNSLSFQEYKSTLAKSQVVTGTADAEMVNRVGTRIANAAIKYYNSIGRGGEIADYQWEFHLLRDSQLNAWCMPGGKVAVFTGILPVTKDETGLAVVLGHEISHALAGHGNERMSQAMIAQGLGQVIGGSINNAQAAQVFGQLYPVGAQVGLLSYGRKQESEADQMGLYLMAMAGYDPREAPAFWDRMNAMAGPSQEPQFLSTHPNPANRKAALEQMMPKALEYYTAATGKR